MSSELAVTHVPGKNRLNPLGAESWELRAES
jgi:hypothetical protein